MSIRTRLGAALGALVLTFGIAGVGYAGNQPLDNASVRTPVDQSCGVEPLDVELIIDASGSMQSNSSGGKTRMEWAKLSAKQLVESLDNNGGVGGSGAHQVGVSYFKGTDAAVALALGGSDADAVNAAIDGLVAGGNTPLQEGMDAGAGDLTSNGRSGATHIVILLSDGRPNPDQGPDGAWANNSTGQRPTLAEGNAYLGSADIAFSVALGQGGQGAQAVDLGLMTLLGPDGAYHVVNGGELPDVFASIYQQISCPPNVSVAKAVDKETANPGDTLNYTITVANDGGSDALNVDVNDDISALLAHGTFGTCDNGCANDADSVDWSGLTIPMDGSLELHFSIVLSSTGWADGVTHLPNTVVVDKTNCAADGDDADCSTDTTVTNVPAGPLVVVTKAVDKEAALPGDTLNYTITVANDGGTDATGVDVNDDISALLAHGTFGTCDNGCANDADSVDWTDLSIPKGGSLELHFSIVLGASGWADGITHLPNTVVVDETNCAADGDDAHCSTDTEVANFSQSQAAETDAPTNLPTGPNTATIGGNGTSAPADGAWLLLVALGALLTSVVVLTPAPARRRK